MAVEFAKVKSGHDKNHIYMVKEENENYVFLVNGTTKKLVNPKKKSKKHIQIIKNLPKYIAELFSEDNGISDEMIQNALREYEASIKTEKKD